MPYLHFLSLEITDRFWPTALARECPHFSDPSQRQDHLPVIGRSRVKSDPERSLAAPRSGRSTFKVTGRRSGEASGQNTNLHRDSVLLQRVRRCVLRTIKGGLRRHCPDAPRI